MQSVVVVEVLVVDRVLVSLSRTVLPLVVVNERCSYHSIVRVIVKVGFLDGEGQWVDV